MSESFQPARDEPFSQERAAFRCVLALLSVVALGTLGFMWTEGDWGVWKSLFFTLITVTTVGYDNQDLSIHGEMFAAVLLLVGIATATYSLSSLIQIAVSYQLGWRKKMQNKIDKLEGHFVICGSGRIGRTVCGQLSTASVDFVVVERDTEAFESAVESGYLAVHGDTTDDDVLLRAGVARARGVVCVLNSDADNVFITLCVRELNPTAFIASRANTEFAVRRVEQAGASLVISPYTTAGINIANAILRPDMPQFVKVREADANGVEFGEVRIPNDSHLMHQNVRQLGATYSAIVLVAIERHGDAIINPDIDECFLPGDIAIVAGLSTDLARLARDLDSEPFVAREEEAEFVASV